MSVMRNIIMSHINGGGGGTEMLYHAENLSFESIDDYIDTHESILRKSDEITIVVKGLYRGGSSNNKTFFSEMNTTSPTNGIVMRFNNAHCLQIGTVSGNITDLTAYSYGSTFSVAVTIDKINGYVRMVDNKNTEKGLSVSGSKLIAAEGVTATLGRDQSYTDRWFKGTIYSVDVYSRLLSGSEILEKL